MANKQIQIKTGLSTYDLIAENGEKVGEISVSTKDIGLMTRSKKAISMIEDAKKDMDFDSNGNAVSDDLFQDVENATQKIKDAIDYMFGRPVSDEVFKYVSPLSIVDDRTCVEFFLDNALPIIMEDLQSEYKESEKKIAKYTG